MKKNNDTEADKGGAVIIMNTKLYVKMISDNLNDETTYKMVQSNCDAKVMKGIAKIIEKYRNNLTKKDLRKKNILQGSDITQVISMTSLKFTNLN